MSISLILALNTVNTEGRKSCNRFRIKRLSYIWRISIEINIILLISHPRLCPVEAQTILMFRSGVFLTSVSQCPFNLVAKHKNNPKTLLAITHWGLPWCQQELSPKSGKIWSSAQNDRILCCFPAVTPCTDQKMFCIQVLMLLSSVPGKVCTKQSWYLAQNGLNSLCSGMLRPNSLLQTTQEFYRN